MARVRAKLPLLALLALLITLSLPASAGAFNKAIWGEVTHNGVNQFPLYRQLGVSIYETDLHWDQLAPTRPRHPADPNDPAYQWPSAVDQAVALAPTYGMQVMIQLTGAPAWANGGHGDPAWAPRYPRDFAAFATAAAKRYRSVRQWMIWGEPTRAGNFRPIAKAIPGEVLTGRQLTAPHLYARILDSSYGALKAVNRGNKVIGGSTYTAGVLDTLQWISNLRLPNRHPPRMDMYAHNPFSFAPPSLSAGYDAFDEVQFQDLPELAGWIDHYLHRRMPLFLSEFTIPTAGDTEFNFYVDPKTAGQWVADALRLSRGWRRIYALGWVNVYDSPPTTYGGLLTQDGQPKPSFYAFEHG
jgi:hypothetical protein